jgi:hypothetical protein
MSRCWRENMGLSIEAYKKLKIVSEGRDFESDTPEGMVRIYHVPESLAASDRMKEGIYKIEGSWFKSPNMSCTGFGIWREDLARMTGTTEKQIQEHPEQFTSFVELINFPDNEGTIGPKTCAKLFRDFVEWEDRAAAFADSLMNPEDWMDRYVLFRDAFALVGRQGALKFA